MLNPFWRGWLHVWCAAVALFGLVLAGGAFSATDAGARFVFTLLGGAPPGSDPALRFAIGLMGAVTLGWSLTIWPMIAASARRPEVAAALWRPVTLALAAWFVIDSTISVATGFALNAVSNAILLAGWLAPMILGGGLRAPKSAATA